MSLASACSRCLRVLVLLAAILTLAPQGATAQETPAAKPISEVDNLSLATENQSVAVQSQTDDAQIAKRLEDILGATGRYTEAQAIVDDGVVFLSGITQSEKKRAWAEQLALSIEGVVAVVNDITVESGPLWNWEPAWAEGRKILEDLTRSLPLIVLGLIVLGFTLLASRLATRLLTGVVTRKTDNRILRTVISKTIHAAILLAGVYLFLRISGLTRIAATLLGGTGLLGLILGLAFREIAENLLASMLISVQRPFRIGDTIELDGHTGIVQQVTMRGTVLMDFEGNHIQIANAKVYKSTISNLTANPKQRVDFGLGIGYDASISQAQELARQVLVQHPAVLQEPAPMVLVEALGASTVNLRSFCWIDGHEHSKNKVLSVLMRLTLLALDEAGISLPDESREVIFPQGVPVQMLESGRVSQPSAKVVAEHARRRSQAEHAVSEAEGDLSSETREINEQAASSRSPEEGAEILAE